MSQIAKFEGFPPTLTETADELERVPEAPLEHWNLGLIWGAEQIAKAIGRTRRQAFGLLESGQLPARKVGGRWVISRAALAKHFEGTTL